MPFRQAVARAAIALEADLEKNKRWFLLIFTALYFLGSCGVSRWSPLWYDELFTYYLSRVSHASDIWSALSQAADLNPPLSYYLTRISQNLLGDGHLGTRFTAMLGYWVMSLCLFQFVARKCGALYGAVAMLVPALTKALGYAQEARPYGVALAACGASLLCWQAAAEGKRRWLWLIGLIASLGAGISSHYWAVFILAPLAAGELARSAARQRIDWPVWLSLAAGGAPLLLYLPMLRAARHYVVPPISRPEFSSIPAIYEFFLEPAFWPLVGMLAVIAIAPLFRDTERAVGETAGRPRGHELAAAATLAALPVFTVALVGLAHAGIQPRYAIYWIVGLGILAAYGIRFGAARGSAMPGLSFLFLFAIFLLQSVFLSLLLLSPAPRPFRGLPFPLPPDEEKLPVVASTPNLFLQLSHYAEPELASRVVYLADTEIAMRQVRTNTWELGLEKLSRWTPLRIRPYRAFVAAERRFLVYGPHLGVWDWVIRQLMQDGARVEFRGRQGEDFLFLVTSPGAITGR